MKIQNISKYALYAISGVIAVCFLLFFTVGYHNDMDSKGNTIPLLTDLIIVLMYLLGLATAGVTCYSMVKSAKSSSGVDETQITGVPGGKVTMFTAAATVVSLIIGLLLGLGEPDFITNSGATTPGYMVTMVDVFLWSMYILAFVSVVAVIYASTGLATKSATKK